MSPRAKVSPTKSNVSTEAFLLVCIKSAKEKLNVDFKQVAAILKMSEGGAANKYRALIKKVEQEGLVPGTNPRISAQTISNIPVTPTAGKKRKNLNFKSTSSISTAFGITLSHESEALAAQSDNEEPPKKKVAVDDKKMDVRDLKADEAGAIIIGKHDVFTESEISVKVEPSDEEVRSDHQ